MNHFNHLKFIEKLLAFSPRQGEGERQAAEFIQATLKQSGLNFAVQKFLTKISLTKRAELWVDGQALPCQGCSFVSGEIKDKSNVISSLTDLPADFVEPNINFNPKSEAISLSYYYWGPALAIRRQDVARVLEAKKVRGYVEVEPSEEESANILVGNAANPQKIVIVHYDCLKTGATDNASGVAVAMGLLAAGEAPLADTLFVFSGNEELSYDKPVYWGHGFRVFEAKYQKLMARAKKIVVVDSVGNASPAVTQNSYILNLAFPIKNLKTWASKIYLVEGDLEKLLSVYHSDTDTLAQLEEKYLKQAVEVLSRAIN